VLVAHACHSQEAEMGGLWSKAGLCKKQDPINKVTRAKMDEDGFKNSCLAAKNLEFKPQYCQKKKKRKERKEK
jgi:hypothetical protein